MAIAIKLMNNSPSFSDASVEADRVGTLRKELNVSSGATVNVDGVVANDTTEVKDGSYVAVVSNNKTGGDKSDK